MKELEKTRDINVFDLVDRQKRKKDVELYD